MGVHRRRPRQQQRGQQTDLKPVVFGFHDSISFYFPTCPIGSRRPAAVNTILARPLPRRVLWQSSSTLGRVSKISFEFKFAISLAPGFSPVWSGRVSHSRFNGLFGLLEAAEAAEAACRPRITGLKPGANESKNQAHVFENTPQCWVSHPPPGQVPAGLARISARSIGIKFHVPGCAGWAMVFIVCLVQNGGREKAQREFWERSLPLIRRLVSYHLNIHIRNVSIKTAMMPIMPAQVVISTAANAGLTRPSPESSKHLRVALADIKTGIKNKTASGTRKSTNAKNDFANNGRKNGSG